jgi:hypothetical protein
MNTSNSKRRRALGGICFGIGYILSPFTWWNDAFVNIPLAWLLATLAVRSLGDRVSFVVLFAACYIATNIAGLVLMHQGAAKATAARRGGLLSRLNGAFLGIGVIVCMLLMRGMAFKPAALLQLVR